MPSPRLLLVQLYREQKPLFVLACLLLCVLGDYVASYWIADPRFIVWAFFTGVSATCALLLSAVFLVPSELSPEDPLRKINPPAFVLSNRWGSEVMGLHAQGTSRSEKLYPESEAISNALEELLDLVQRDFINSWYTKVSPNPSFSNEISVLVRDALAKVAGRLQEFDMAEFIVGTVVPHMTSHLADFSSAELAVRGRRLDNNLTESEELDIAIASKYREGHLHPAADLAHSDQKLAQQDHLRKFVDRILPLILPENETNSRIIRIAVREIVSCAILYPIMCYVSEPDTWNQWVFALGNSALQDRKTVRKLRAALDKHATPSRDIGSPHSSGRLDRGQPHAQFIRLSPKDDERTFERFIRSIRQCNTLSDARRLRTEITAQWKRDSMMTESIDNQWAIYMRRLETGKRLVDQKVATLTAGTESSTRMKRVESESMIAGKIPHAVAASSKIESYTLEDVMKDPAGLMYFMEYMDRQSRMALVQFWLVVNGLRNPLEDDVESDDEDEHVASSSFAPWTASDRNDIAQIHDVYLSTRELRISERSKRSVKDFLKFGSKATQAQYVKARWAILRAQSAVYEEMNKKYFHRFKASDLYFKYLASDDAGGRASSARASIDSGRPSEILQAVPRTASPFLGPKSADLLDSAGWDSDPLGAHSPEESDSLQGSGFLPREKISLTPDANIVEAMEAALNDIIEEPIGSVYGGRGSPFLDSRSDSLFKSGESPRDSLFRSSESPRDSLFKSSESPRDSLFKSGESPRGSLDSSREPEMKVARTVKTVMSKNSGSTYLKPPSIASLGLVAPESRDGVFETELFPDEHHHPEDEVMDDDLMDPDKTGTDNDEIHQAEPGNLGLAEAILELTFDIEKLLQQETIVNSMLNKAELTNNTVEMRILRKSKASLQREIRRKELQKQQYIVQESDNSLYGRSDVQITSTIVGNENGQDYALYVIEVYRQGGEQVTAAKWHVARRYSEFFQLHQSLKRFDSVKDLDFPRRRVVMKLQKDFVEKRRIALDNYLKQLVKIPEVCRDRDFRSFLSTSRISPNPTATTTTASSTTDLSDTRKALITRLYDSIADGMEDVLGNLPILDQLSLAAGKAVPNNPNPEISAIAEAEEEASVFDTQDRPFIKPICDLFLEVFGLNRKKNWLRGRAVVAVLQQMLGGTIERKIKEQTATMVEEAAVVGYAEMLKKALWPEGVFIGDSERSPAASGATQIRSEKEKERSKQQAKLILAKLIPDLSASVVGRSNADQASKRLFSVCNNHRLNTSILYIILDELVEELFHV